MALLLLATPVIVGDTVGPPTTNTAGAPSANTAHESTDSTYNFNVGVGRVDITPVEKVTLAGSPSPKETSAVDTPLFVKAMVISVGGQKLVIVTLDTLKYPTNLAIKALKYIETITLIPAENIIISASHTHFGPLYSYYEDRLITSIGQAVVLADNDLSPCRISVSKGKVEGANQNRRLLKDGGSWNIWLLKPDEKDRYPAEGPADTGLEVLAIVGKDERYKAILYNYACHPVSTRGAMISADYPGHVQKYVEGHLGYEVPTLFLLGSCGDVNSKKSNADIGRMIGGEIFKSLANAEVIGNPTLLIKRDERELPGRRNIKFSEEDISLKWKGQLEHYRRAFERTRLRKKSSYKAIFNGIRLGDDFAIVTNPVELFCEIGMNIKAGSPFKHTMVGTLTNGASGYVPTAKSFELGGYETWFGEHSFLGIQAGEVIEKESLLLLKQLKSKE